MLSFGAESFVFQFAIQSLKIKICGTIVLPFVVYGCETLSLTLREECRLRVLRRIFGPKRPEVSGEWRKLYNEAFNDLYSLPSIIWVIKSRRMRWVGRVAHVGGGERCVQLVGRPEGKTTWKTQA